MREVVIGDGSVNVDGEVVFVDENADYYVFIRDAFKAGGGQNMKFYKMDVSASWHMSLLTGCWRALTSARKNAEWFCPVGTAVSIRI